MDLDLKKLKEIMQVTYSNQFLMPKMLNQLIYKTLINLINKALILVKHLAISREGEVKTQMFLKLIHTVNLQLK